MAINCVMIELTSRPLPMPAELTVDMSNPFQSARGAERENGTVSRGRHDESHAVGRADGLAIGRRRTDLSDFRAFRWVACRDQLRSSVITCCGN
jgi:hypothetical protein